MAVTESLTPAPQADIVHHHRRPVHVIGAFLGVTSFLGLCSEPWVIDYRKSLEVTAATTAKHDVRDGLLAQTGSVLVNNDSLNSVLLQPFNDKDTYTIKVGPDDPAKAVTLYRQAAHALEGREKNRQAAADLDELITDPSPDAAQAAKIANEINTRIVNGDMISWTDVEVAGSMLASLALGVFMFSRPDSQAA